MKQDPVYYKSYYERTKERKLALGSKWYRGVVSNPESKQRFKEMKNAKFNHRYRNDPQFNTRVKLKKQLRRLILGKYDNTFCWNLVGCTKDQLRRHFQSRFELGMSWDNYGIKGWVVDHIRPVCTFNLLNTNHRNACFHFTNLQPMWYEQNRKKSITHVAS